MKYQPLEISEAELDELREHLGAAIYRYRGKRDNGRDVDTVEFTKSLSCQDLAVSEEYGPLADGTSAARVDLTFDYPEVGPVHLRVSTLHGSIWFMNAVPEAVLDHVFETLQRVKAS